MTSAGDPGNAEANPFREAAATLGIEYVPGQLETAEGRGEKVSRAMLGNRHIVGRVDDVEVRVSAMSRGRRLTILYGVRLPATTVELDVTRRTLWGNLVSQFSRRTVLTGDGPYDALVWVRSRDVEAARAYLTGERRQAIADLVTILPNARLRAATIDGAASTSRVQPPSAREIVATVMQCVTTAKALES